MDAFAFRLTTHIEFGSGISSVVADRAAALHATRVLVVTDKGVRAAGLVDEPLERLTEAGLAPVVFDDVAPNPRESSVAEGARVAAQEGCDFLVAVGGGSPMDTAKGIGILLTHGGAILEFADANRLHRAITPLIAVPTTAGSGSEVTFVADISDTAHTSKASVVSPFMAPRLALVDPQLTLSLPRALTASTGLDALTHAIEAYSGRQSTPIVDSMALSAISLLGRYLPVAFANGKNLVAREQVMLASLLAGVAVANTGNGLVHSMAQAAAARYDVPHGIANAIYLPAVMAHNAIALPEKSRQIAAALGEDISGCSLRDSLSLAVRGIQGLVSDLRIPSAAQVGVQPADFPLLAEEALADPAAASNPREVTKADVVALFAEAQ